MTPQELPSGGTFYRLDPYWAERHEGDAAIPLSHLEHIDAPRARSTDFYGPPATMWSDYSGSLVDKANVQALANEYGDAEGVIEIYGSHGTSGIAFRVEDVTPEMAEAFAALQDYPILNEELHTELELEAQQEAWDSFVRTDFKAALGKNGKAWLDEIGGEVLADDPQLYSEVEDALEDIAEQIDEEELFRLFNEAADKANVYWLNEQGDSVSIDVDRIAEEVTIADLLELAQKDFRALVDADQFYGKAAAFAAAYDEEHPRSVPTDSQILIAWKEILGGAGVEDEGFETEERWRRAVLTSLDELRQGSLPV